jgi:hypothetical protein
VSALPGQNETLTAMARYNAEAAVRAARCVEYADRHRRRAQELIDRSAVRINRPLVNGGPAPTPEPGRRGGISGA